jgi:hypothetical protein
MKCRAEAFLAAQRTLKECNCHSNLEHLRSSSTRVTNRKTAVTKSFEKVLNRMRAELRNYRIATYLD